MPVGFRYRAVLWVVRAVVGPVGGGSLAIAACVQVRASSKRVARSFAVVDFNAQRSASSAYRWNSLASDMTVLHVRPKSGQTAHVCCGA
jgi:hypothetical protein